VHATARRDSIAQWLREEGRVDVVDVATRLGVAPETVRRDLRSLEGRGMLERVHGGAVPRVATLQGAVVSAASAVEDLPVVELLWRELPRSGTILLGAGPLSLALAQVIVNDPPDHTGLTLVTNSLGAALVLSRLSRLSVYNLGGTVSPLTLAQEGDWALTELGRLHTDVSVVFPTGISAEGGLSQDTPAAAAISEAEVAAGSVVVALVDAAAVGRSAFVQFAPLSALDRVAVVGRPDPSSLQGLTDRGVVIVSGADTGVS